MDKEGVTHASALLGLTTGIPPPRTPPELDWGATGACPARIGLATLKDTKRKSATHGRIFCIERTISH